jgi:hypothetical protein
MTVYSFLESTPFMPSFVMPTGAHSITFNEARLSELKVNCAEWRHLTHQAFTQLSEFLFPALDFSIPQRALNSQWLST